MSKLRFVAMPTDSARAFQAGAEDANGQTPEPHIVKGTGHPCRHCLAEIAEGDPYLIFAYRPFPAPQPYAEIGPVFLHVAACTRHAESAEPPAMFLGWERLLLRGYGSDDRIVYGTGRVMPTGQLATAAATLLEQPDIAYAHVRSASNNCYQCRIERG